MRTQLRLPDLFDNCLVEDPIYAWTFLLTVWLEIHFMLGPFNNCLVGDPVYAAVPDWKPLLFRLY